MYESLLLNLLCHPYELRRSITWIVLKNLIHDGGLENEAGWRERKDKRSLIQEARKTISGI